MGSKIHNRNSARCCTHGDSCVSVQLVLPEGRPLPRSLSRISLLRSGRDSLSVSRPSSYKRGNMEVRGKKFKNNKKGGRKQEVERRQTKAEVCGSFFVARRDDASINLLSELS